MGDVPYLGSIGFIIIFTRQLLQRIVRTDSFYRSQKGWFDKVLVQAEDDGEDGFGVWFACALCLLHV